MQVSGQWWPGVPCFHLWCLYCTWEGIWISAGARASSAVTQPGFICEYKNRPIWLSSCESEHICFLYTFIPHFLTSPRCVPRRRERQWVACRLGRGWGIWQRSVPGCTECWWNPGRVPKLPNGQGEVALSCSHPEALLFSSLWVIRLTGVRFRPGAYPWPHTLPRVCGEGPL